MSNPNNSPEQKKAWRDAQGKSSRHFHRPLPMNAVRFWEWNRPGILPPSPAFGAFKKGVRGKKLSRNLDFRRTGAAWKKSQDPKHQYKFLSRSQKMGMALRQLVGGKAQ